MRAFAIDMNPLAVLCGFREPINTVLRNGEPFRLGNFSAHEISQRMLCFQNDWRHGNLLGKKWARITWGNDQSDEDGTGGLPHLLSSSLAIVSV